jgi:hypothetical protein
VIEIETDRGVIRYLAYRAIEIRMNDGSRQQLLLSDKPHALMLQAFWRCLRDRSTELCAASLEMARAHVVTCNVASEAAPVTDVPPQHIRHVHESEDNIVRTIDQIVPALKASVQRKCMLHETGLLPWARSAHTKQVGNYVHFSGCCKAKGAAHRPAVSVEVFHDANTAGHRPPAAVK